MILDFRTRQNGKTYYEYNKSWKDLKKHIKIILDSTQKSRYEKCIEITAIIDWYFHTYLKEGDKNEK